MLVSSSVFCIIECSFCSDNHYEIAIHYFDQVSRHEFYLDGKELNQDKLYMLVDSIYLEFELFSVESRTNFYCFCATIRVVGLIALFFRLFLAVALATRFAGFS